MRDAIITHREFLWALCYRMTGNAADADDLVQDVAERALCRPPAELDRDLRPWLTRVAMNLARDHLRRRKRAVYRGTWLPGPAPIVDGALADLVTADARYSERESATIAFLAALEALGPAPRAVLILRDVMGYSVRETAALLEMSEANVKTTHHRARRTMADYDAARRPPDTARMRHHRRALQALLGHLAANNVEGLRALLSEQVRAHNDADDGLFAARKPVVGRDKVILFHLKVNRLHLRRGDGMPRWKLVELNAEPAVLVDWPATDPHLPRRMLIRIGLDDAGRIVRIDTLASGRKLRGLDFDALPALPAPRQLVETLAATISHPPLRDWAPAAAARSARALWTRVGPGRPRSR